MCGIAGIVQLDGAPVDADLLGRMVEQLRHRGPDDAGIRCDGPVGLGHARLSIIDLAGGGQPMATADGHYLVSYNGEIFNYLELRDELVAAGHTFRTRSDTEVILAAYRRWGPRCVERFNGQWAFALWDRRDRALLLSRDRLGVRPLYYTRLAGRLLFASEIKALLADPQVPRALDPVALDQLFTLWAPLPPRTVFRGIEELPPGCQLTLNLGGKGGGLEGPPQLARYWQLDYTDGAGGMTLDACAESLRGLLDDAARLRLRSDVPVGAYLSGGLDSSITTALVRRHTERLRTFSVTFDDAEFDESPYQRELVAALNTDHQALHCTADDIAQVFPQVVWHAERPMLRTAPGPLWLLAQQVREAGFKVVLTGEGADEILGGYDIFKEAKLRRFCALAPESLRRTRLFERLYPYLPNLQAQSLAYRKAFFRVRPEEIDEPFFSHLPRWEMTAQIKRLFSADLAAELAGHDATADVAAILPVDYPRWPAFCQWQWLETAILMPGYILSTQGDRMSLAHGIEGRFPFLDHRIAEFAAAIPPRWKMRGLNEKFVLRRAVAGLLPEGVRRRTKQPYRAPDGASFFDAETGRARADYVEELLDPRRIAADGVFQPQAVARLVGKFRRGQAIGVKDNMALVGVLSTQLLAAQFLGDGAAGPGVPQDTALAAAASGER